MASILKNPTRNKTGFRRVLLLVIGALAGILLFKISQKVMVSATIALVIVLLVGKIVKKKLLKESVR